MKFDYLFLKNLFLLNLSIVEIFFLSITILILIIFNSFFSKLIIKKIISFFKIQESNIAIFNQLEPPLKFFFYLIPLTVFINFINIDNTYYREVVLKIYQSLFTIFIFWFIYKLANPISLILSINNQKFPIAVKIWFIKSFKFLIFFLGIVTVLEIWGVKVATILAGLGLIGVAVALGAQDLFKNLISGLLILLEDKFKVGDIINVPNQFAGTVEHIGFRSTIIKQFDTSIVSLPNNIFADSYVINLSRREHRRINITIALVYETSTKQLKEITNQIQDFIHNSNDFKVSEEYKLFVNLDKFNDSSIDLSISVFTKTNDWTDYMLVKEKLSYEIKKIIELNGSSFAYPTQRLHIENKSKLT